MLQNIKGATSYPVQNRQVTNSTPNYFKDNLSLPCFNGVSAGVIKRYTDTDENGYLKSFVSTTAKTVNKEDIYESDTDAINTLRQNEDYNKIRKDLIKLLSDYEFASSSCLQQPLLDVKYIDGLKKLAQRYIKVVSQICASRTTKALNCDEYALWGLSNIYIWNLLQPGFIAYPARLNNHSLLSKEFLAQYYPGAQYDSRDHDHVFIVIRRQSDATPLYIVDLWQSKIKSSNYTPFIGTIDEYISFLNQNADGHYIIKNSGINIADFTQLE
ncbi:MAG: hypothetical protein ACK4M7_00715 [Burkholderiales bacterium]